MAAIEVLELDSPEVERAEVFARLQGFAERDELLPRELTEFCSLVITLKQYRNGYGGNEIWLPSVKVPRVILKPENPITIGLNIYLVYGHTSRFFNGDLNASGVYVEELIRLNEGAGGKLIWTREYPDVPESEFLEPELLEGEDILQPQDCARVCQEVFRFINSPLSLQDKLPARDGSLNEMFPR